MTIPMPSLKRAPNGDHFARKVIPTDVRDAYAAAYGVKHEERFRHPAGTPVGEAKRIWAEWLVTVEGRISALRAAATGSPVTLSHRDLHAIASRWYLWFTTQNEEDPGTFEQWQHASDEMRHVWESGFASLDDREEVEEEIGRGHRRRIRAKLTELARLPSFLASEALSLSPESLEALLDGPLPDEFGAALLRLMKVSRGDYRTDSHAADAEQVARLKTPTGIRPAGWSAWEAFALWVAERKPANQTVNRWRGVLEQLNAHFEGKDVSAYTEQDAVAWKDALVASGKAQAQTINDVWLTAARTVFSWVVKQKKIPTNPFLEVKVAGKKTTGTKGEFADEAIEAILSATLSLAPSRESAQLRAAKRWVPWLCAYTGSRPGEMTQLRGVDVQRHRAGFWTLHITPSAGTVKGSVARTVPVHEHLVAQGFIEFVIAAGQGPLFYSPSTNAESDDPLNPRRPSYVVARNKVGDWVRHLGVIEKGYSPGHSWRHSFARRADRAGISQPRIDAICGWTEGTVKRRYKTPTIEDLAEAIARFPRYEIGTV